MQNLQPFINSLQKFAQKRFKFKEPPKLFLKKDQENAKDVFGKTAFYDPNEKSITLFTIGRHPKDILRSFAHELVHHCQNLRGDLSPEKCVPMGVDYAQKDNHMREMEREAYEKGNLCFRDWEDGIKVAMQQENNQLKENKKMVKISKKELKGLIGKILEARLEEEVVKDEKAAALNKAGKDRAKAREDAEKKEKMAKEKKGLEDALAKQRALRKEDTEELEEGGCNQRDDELKEDAFDDSHYCIHHGGVEHNGSIAMAEAIQHVAPDANGFISHYDMKLADGTILENVAAEDIQVTNASLAEAHGAAARRNVKHKPYKNKMEENEELEEAEMTAKQKKFAALAPPKDKITYADKIAGATKNESKIQTPEQEQKLYESRFNKRNEEIFDKLKKLWTR